MVVTQRQWVLIASFSAPPSCSMVVADHAWLISFPLKVLICSPILVLQEYQSVTVSLLLLILILDNHFPSYHHISEGFIPYSRNNGSAFLRDIDIDNKGGLGCLFFRGILSKKMVDCEFRAL